MGRMTGNGVEFGEMVYNMGECGGRWEKRVDMGKFCTWPVARDNSPYLAHYKHIHVFRHVTCARWDTPHSTYSTAL